MPPPTPSTAPARSVVGDCPGVGGSKTASKSIKKSIIFLDRFLIRFGTHFGAMLAPFCSIFGLRSLLDTHLYQKCRCSRKALRTNEKTIFLTPRRIGNRSKIAPRRLQEVTFSLLNLHLFFYSFLFRFGSQNASLWAPFLLPKSFQKS